MMKNRQFLLAGMSALFLFAVNLTGGASTAWGAIVQTDETSTESELEYPASATDLINAGQPTLDAVVHLDYVGDGASTPDNLNNGSAGISAFVPDENGYVAATATSAIDVGGTNYAEWKSTYLLNLSGAPLGYDITSIQSISGWPDHRSNQRYEVLVAVVGDPTFQSLGVFHAFAPFGTNSTRITLTDSSGAIASGVEAIQFHFYTGAAIGDVSELIYREIDVFGAPTTSTQGLPGDFDDNDVVDGDDLTLWKGAFGLTDVGDADDDEDSDGADFLVWQRQFGATSIAATAIPEPAGAMLMLSVAVAALSMRRRGVSEDDGLKLLV